MNPIHIGTAGWSYDDWQHAVYPPGQPSDRLATVARYLDCVEIDSSFYRPPTARTVAGWVRATPPTFRFLAKAWQRFTHERATPWTTAERDLFLGAFTPLRESTRLDVLLFQFPWSFRHEPRNVAWLDRIADDFADWPVAVEVRHDSWADTAELFRQRRFTYCNIDQPQLDHCLPPSALVTSDTGYFRLHGRNAGNWFKPKEEIYGSRYDHHYQPAELTGLLKPIQTIAGKARKTFVIFNNHKDGKAFSNALQLKARLEPGPVRAPAALLKRFPELTGIIQPDGHEQLSLV